MHVGEPEVAAGVAVGEALVVEAEEVEHATIGVLSAGFSIVAAPEEDKRNPKSLVDMQFSMPFGAAVALPLAVQAARAATPYSLSAGGRSARG